MFNVNNVLHAMNVCVITDLSYYISHKYAPNVGVQLLKDLT